MCILPQSKVMVLKTSTRSLELIEMLGHLGPLAPFFFFRALALGPLTIVTLVAL